MRKLVRKVEAKPSNKQKNFAVRATRAGSRLAACWLEDVCTSSSSRPFASRSENLLHAIACENACASSRATTFHLFLFENRWASSPVLQRFFAPQHPVHPLAKIHRTSQTDSASHFRTSGLARLLPARAASENLSTSHLKIKYFLMRARKDF
jgi:hypothetical protein